MSEPLAKPENKFRTFYHGTYPGRIEGILRTGLDPNYAGQGGGTLPGLNEKDPRPKLFLTTSPSYAKFYARMAAGMEAQAKAKEEGKGWFRQRLAQGTPAPPLRIDLPSDFKVHELAGPGWIVPGDEHYVTDLIPPEYIKASNDLTALAPKWSERGHLLAALPKHLADAQEAIKSQQNIDKEMTDLSLIASAWLKSQQQKELLEARLKRFKETAGYPSMASILAAPAIVGNTNKEHAMNNLNKAAEFGSAMGKSAGLFWKKLDKPVGIKAIWGNEDDPADSHDPVDFDRPTVHARLGAYRTMEPRLLTRLFSSPSKDYKNMLAGMQSVIDREPDADQGGVGLESPIGRAIWASHFLPSMLSDRYSFGTDAPLGNEDVFEDTRTPYYKGLQGHMKSHGMPFPEALKQITHPEILNPKLKGGGIKIEDIKMDKSAGLFWKKLDKPVGIKSLFGPDDGATSMRLDAERTMEPRLLTRLFSSPRKDYDHMLSAIKLNEEYGEDRDSPANQALATTEGRAMLASYMLPRWYPDRYKQEGDSPIGGEDIFENAVYQAGPRLKKIASFGAMMGKMAGGVVDLGKGSHLYSDKERYEPGSNARFSLTWGEEHMKDFEDAIMDHVKQLNREDALRIPRNPKYDIQEKDLEDYDKIINWLPANAQAPHREKLNLLKTPSRADMGKIAASSDRPGLWANIRAKKERGEAAAKPGDKDYPDAKNWKKVTAISEKKAETPAWQRSEGKNPDGGLNNKGRASLKAEGKNIKRPQPEGGARRDSFCARMGGMKAKLTSEATANDPDSRINKALRKWSC